VGCLDADLAVCAVVAGAEFGHAGGDDDAAAIFMFQAVEQVEGVGEALWVGIVGVVEIDRA